MVAEKMYKWDAFINAHAITVNNYDYHEKLQNTNDSPDTCV